MAKWRVPPASGSRLRNVEGMRALAACSIVVYHVWRYADPAGAANLGPLNRILLNLPVGVTLFFTLSGFLLYRPFAAAILGDRDQPDVNSYFRNRALRILPAYWVILAVTGLVLGATLVRFDLQRGFLGTRPGLLVRDALFVQNYGRGSMLTGIGPAWSLAIEVVFYLVLPVLAVLGVFAARRAADRSGRRLAAFVPPAVVFLVGMSGKLMAANLVPGFGQGNGWLNDWHSVLERSFWVQADLFTFGMVLAVLGAEAERGNLRIPRWWPGAGAAAAVLMAGSTAWAWEKGWVTQYPYDSLMALACGLLLSVVVLPSPRARAQRWGSRVLESRPAVWIGVVSYSLFLWHEPLTWFLRDHGVTRSGGGGALAVNLLLIGSVSLILSALTYRFVELPALRRKRRYREPEQPQQELELATVPAATG
jgi:peptidoglycan/LPS O-acetylase OafA/YrhL